MLKFNFTKRIKKIKVKTNFEPIQMGEMPANIESWNIRGDQLYLYRMVRSVHIGECDERLASDKPGAISTARWLTTASRILRYYVTCTEPSMILKKLARCANLCAILVSCILYIYIMEKNRAVRRKYIHKPYFNHFSIADEEFKRRYRLSKESVRYDAQLISRDVQTITRNRALSVNEMLLLTLRFYASGNFLITVADYCGVSVMTASRTLKRVSKAFAKLYPKFIEMPKLTEL